MYSYGPPKLSGVMVKRVLDLDSIPNEGGALCEGYGLPVGHQETPILMHTSFTQISLSNFVHQKENVSLDRIAYKSPNCQCQSCPTLVWVSNFLFSRVSFPGDVTRYQCKVNVQKQELMCLLLSLFLEGQTCIIVPDVIGRRPLPFRSFQIRNTVSCMNILGKRCQQKNMTYWKWEPILPTIRNGWKWNNKTLKDITKSLCFCLLF